MAAFILRRLAWAIPTMFGVSLITFLLMHSVPGGPWDAGSRPTSAVVQNTLRQRLGLDQPLHVQYLNYVSHALQGDLGPSYKSSRTVKDIIAQDFPLSAAFGASALLIGVFFGFPVGLTVAYRRNSLLDRVVTAFISFNLAIPQFVLAIVLIVLLSVQWHLISVQFQRDDWKSWVLPCLLLSLGVFTTVARFTRAAALDILGEDYVRTAKMKGLPTFAVLRHHILRNALLPVLTLLGPVAADLITGSFVTETIFGIPGLSKAFILSITGRDYMLLMGVTLFFAALLILFNLLVDIAYAFVDPRISYSIL